MIDQIQTWYVSTTKEKLAIKAQFFATWSDTTDAHVTTFARQLDRHQVECEDHGVTVTKADNVDHFVSQMYAYELFEEKILDDWEESSEKLWGVHTSPLHEALR